MGCAGPSDSLPNCLLLGEFGEHAGIASGCESLNPARVAILGQEAAHE